VIGVHAAGVVPYYMPEHRFHDLLGKSDRHIAGTSARHGAPGHNKWDYEYSLGRVAPDVLIPVTSTRGPLEFGSFNAELLRHPLFARYTLVADCKDGLPVYARNSSP
jgi:hypothetical protein